MQYNLSPFMPLDSVPAWVKNKVTSKEYELWKKMSHHFYIDYSTVNDKLYENKKDSLYKRISMICQAIENGTYDGTIHTPYVFKFVQEPDTCLHWDIIELNRIDENIYFYERNAIIYQSSDNPKACLMCTIWYIYNSRDKKTNIISHKYAPTAGLMEVGGFGAADYIETKDKIYIDFAGSLIYYDNFLKYHEEQVEKAFLFSPE